MKLCILHSSYEGSATPFKDYDTRHHLERHFSGFRWDVAPLLKSTSVQQIVELSKMGYDVFVNLCDGAWDEDRAGIDVVRALEGMRLPFTGATSGFYEPSRETMKRVCRYFDINTPPYCFASDDAGLSQAAESLHFPLIVKHPSSYSSIGMTKRSLVQDPTALVEQGRAMIGAYGGALIEEFIEGREFTVLVAENADDPRTPHAYEPVEFIFPHGESFKHFDLKWIEYERMECSPCDDEALAERLKEVSCRFFAGINGSGYGRCDIRVNGAGEAYMLEINPNCAVFGPLDAPGSADYVLMRDSQGHRGFIERILHAALSRGARQERKWCLTYEPNRHYGLSAACDIEEGEVIEDYEEKAHVLVSRSHVERLWDGEMKSWFHRYAYPLTDEVWVMWSSDPMEWKPINHSCDPNAWLDGLNLTARRRIARGEEITVDYATFCNEEMQDFTCTCGSPICRGIIRGTDFLTEAVEKYGDHLSDYVKNRRKAAGR
ncbi:MAG: SET domain-containing protein-lysine N-methyltransferase [Spirochaetes bacterium]|nr:SET domain-containing protein-lysine N-methyltransferase [Spirochaetota bacterium]